MSKVTSKLQVTIPKAIAEAYRIVPGCQVNWEPAGSVIRVVPLAPAGAETPALDRETRLALFDEATKRQQERNRRRRSRGAKPPRDRGWTREELYERGGSR